MNNTVDKLNIVLIILSAILAYHFPLEIFIFSYAILGPLHYMTEIKWLNSKNYFFSSKNWIWLSIGVVASLILMLPKLYYEYGNMDTTTGEFMLFVNSWSNSVIFISLLLAAGYQFIRSKIGWIILSFLGVLGAILLHEDDFYNTIIGLFIPTIIHVYIFTLLFMIYGAKKSKSNFGYASVILALLVPFVFIFIPLEQGSYLFSDSLKSIYLDNNFHVTPVVFSKYLGLSEGKTFFFYENMELKLMMFMSFIYLYHYLNWFSKTTVIKWHKMLDFKSSMAIFIIWIISLSLFYIDFRLGFLVSLFLSFMHVLLEFPLNMLSIKGIIMPNKDGIKSKKLNINTRG
ncbi:MAG: hypothetical protein ACI94Y_002259 [Maribacter sp.]|jgi:hypothetical protein